MTTRRMGQVIERMPLGQLWIACAVCVLGTP
jgi:hypothetical protein